MVLFWSIFISISFAQISVEQQRNDEIIKEKQQAEQAAKVEEAQRQEEQKAAEIKEKEALAAEAAKAEADAESAEKAKLEKDITKYCQSHYSKSKYSQANAACIKKCAEKDDPTAIKGIYQDTNYCKEESTKNICTNKFKKINEKCCKSAESGEGTSYCSSLSNVKKNIREQKAASACVASAVSCNKACTRLYKDTPRCEQENRAKKVCNASYAECKAICQVELKSTYMCKSKHFVYNNSPSNKGVGADPGADTAASPAIK